ncbi:MAG: hybrid sensor histidine kinase/response regulator [Anaerolineaceae bacterium]|nr:MAG: hybrid sensor histidine kinase/response regulator [Anaerolineaceae bacterium]
MLPFRVLLVEDNPQLLDVLSLGLAASGYDVTTAVNGRMALEYLRRRDLRFDVIVSDVMMPELDGFGLLREVHHDPELLTIPFIFLTSLDSLDHVRSAKRMGVDDYLMKPVRIEDVVISIENRLQRARVWLDAGKRQANQSLMDIVAGKRGNMTRLLEAFGVGELLIEELEEMPDDFSWRALDSLHNVSQQADRLISQIVILTKVDCDVITPFGAEQLSAVDLRLALEATIESLREDFAPADVDRLNSLFFDGVDQVTVPGFWDLLTTIFSEILRNALIFGGDLPVSVIIGARDGFGFLRVVDGGRGVNPAYLNSLTDRFFKLANTDKPQQGAGLGLSLVKEGLRLLHGHLEIANQNGGGLSVTAYLPLAPDPDQIHRRV